MTHDKRCILNWADYAEEVVLRMLTTICAVSQNKEDAICIQNYFQMTICVFTWATMNGEEIRRCFKERHRSSKWCAKGVGYGDNTKAALITRLIGDDPLWCGQWR